MSPTGLDALTLLSIGCSLALLLCVSHDPALLVRPSFLITTLVHIRLQWPSVVSDEIVTGQLSAPGNYYLLVHGFVVASIGSLLIAGLGINRYSRSIWGDATRTSTDQVEGIRRQIPWLLAVTLFIAALYFAVVPFSSTGLYALLTNPTGLNDARHASLSGLNNAAVGYLSTWLINTFAPMLLAASALIYLTSRRGIGLLLLSVILLTVTGSRAGFALALVVLGMTYALIRWGRWRVLIPAAVVGFTLVVTTTALITLAREGRQVTKESYVTYANDIGLGRIFTTPLKTSVYHVDYADTVGPLGIATVRPLATLFDREFILLPGVIGQTYVAPTSDTIISNTNFLGGYYAGFGLWAIAISIAGLLLFDLLLIPLSRATDFALPIVAVLVVKAIGASEGVLHTSFFNGGYVLLPFIAWMVGSRRRRLPRTGSLGRAVDSAARPVLGSRSMGAMRRMRPQRLKLQSGQRRARL